MAYHCVVFLCSSLVLLAALAIDTAAFQPSSVYVTRPLPSTASTTSVSILHPSPPLKIRATTNRLQKQAHLYPLFAATNDDGSSSTAGEVDFDALIKYHASIVIQMGILYSLLTGFDYVSSSLLATDSIAALPFWSTCILFYGLSLKSRTFNPLDNSRPDLAKAVASSMEDEQDSSGGGGSKGFGDRVMPSWTPPGVIFPIMWLLIIGPTRAYTASLVYASTGHLADPAILALMFHLSVGDVWNTINNTERRFGAAVTGVLCVSLANLNAVAQFYQVDETAGLLLGATMLWFTVASALIVQTWRLNPVDEETGDLDSIYPVIGGGSVETRFSWFGDMFA